MSNPYFSIGEEVILVSRAIPESNGEYAISDHYFGEGRLVDSGEVDIAHNYRLEGEETHLWFDQSALRKKHKPAEDSEKWSEIMSNINPTTLPIEE